MTITRHFESNRGAGLTDDQLKSMKGCGEITIELTRDELRDAFCEYQHDFAESMLVLVLERDYAGKLVLTEDMVQTCMKYYLINRLHWGEAAHKTLKEAYNNRRGC